MVIALLSACGEKAKPKTWWYCAYDMPSGDVITEYHYDVECPKVGDKGGTRIGQVLSGPPPTPTIGPTPTFDAP
jgi:hypothetical protein